MTFQTNQIQAIIAEIDGVLQKNSGVRLPWLASSETEKPRQVLERVRDNLKLLQQQLAPATEASEAVSPQAQIPSAEAVQAELAALEQQRNALIQEIQQLERQRQTYGISAQPPIDQQQIMAQLLQVLTGRLQESLTQQLPQTLSQLQAEAQLLGYESTSTTPASSAEAEEAAERLAPQAQAEQLRTQQARLHRLLSTLDSKLNLMFETLQKNLQKYQTSLSQGLETMHDLSGQNEVILNEVVTHLEQALEQVAAQSAAPPQPNPSLEAPSQLRQDSTPVASEIPFPYAGIELPISLSESEPRSPLEAPENIEAAPERTEEPELIDQITTLTDLIDPPTFTEEPPLSEAGVTSLPEAVGEVPDAQATLNPKTSHQEEELLPINQADVPPAADVELWLGIKRLQELSEDMASLEQPTTAPVAPPAAETPVTHEETSGAALTAEPDAESLAEEAPLPDESDAIPEAEALNSAIAEEEEAEVVIPDEILAEFDELFGDTPQNIPLPPVAAADPDLTPPTVDNEEVEPEKKK